MDAKYKGFTVLITEMKCKLLIWIIQKSGNFQHIVKRKKSLNLAKYF